MKEEYAKYEAQKKSPKKKHIHKRREPFSSRAQRLTDSMRMREMSRKEEPEVQSAEELSIPSMSTHLEALDSIMYLTEQAAHKKVKHVEPEGPPEELISYLNNSDLKFIPETDALAYNIWDTKLDAAEFGDDPLIILRELMAEIQIRAR